MVNDLTGVTIRFVLTHSASTKEEMKDILTPPRY